MPELPDVEAFRRHMDRLARGRTVSDVEVHAKGRMLEAPAAAVVRALRGRTLGGAERIGKWLFVPARGGPWLALHFGMTGSLAPIDDDLPPATRLALRFREKGSAASSGAARSPRGTRVNGVAFTDPRRFGRIALAESPAAFAEERGLGPDAAAVGARAFLDRLEGRRGGVKAALLDQSVVAGIGNLWADETLFQARVHPATPLDALDRDERLRLHRTMRHALRTALRKPGDYDALPRSWLLPHREEGGRCPRCGAPLARGTVAGRTSYWCSREQRKASPP